METVLHIIIEPNFMGIGVGIGVGQWKHTITARRKVQVLFCSHITVKTKTLMAHFSYLGNLVNTCLTFAFSALQTSHEYSISSDLKYTSSMSWRSIFDLSLKI